VRVYDAHPIWHEKLEKYRVFLKEVGTLILTGNITHQKEQLFSLPFWRKTLRSGLKK
jgi:hypothetical protein